MRSSYKTKQNLKNNQKNCLEFTTPSIFNIVLALATWAKDKHFSVCMDINRERRQFVCRNRSCLYLCNTCEKGQNSFFFFFDTRFKFQFLILDTLAVYSIARTATSKFWYMIRQWQECWREESNPLSWTIALTF